MNSDRNEHPAIDIVDGYFHAGLDKYLPFEAIAAAHEQFGVAGGVAVQHLDAPGNDYLLEHVRASAGAYKAVLMTDFTSPAAAGELAAMAAAPEVIGLRIVCEAGNGWPDQVQSARAHGLCPFLLFRGGIGSAGADLVAVVRAGDVRVVLTHAVRATLALDDSVLDALAESQALALFTPTPIAAAPGSHSFRLLERFGTDRVIWGSDYPHAEAIDLDWLKADVDQAEIVAKAGANARRWWW